MVLSVHFYYSKEPKCEKKKSGAEEMCICYQLLTPISVHIIGFYDAVLLRSIIKLVSLAIIKRGN